MFARQTVRLTIAVLGLIACSYAFWNSGREGLSTLLFSFASRANQLDAADRAVYLNQSNPDAHYVRARLLSDRGERDEAIKDYERAVALRPHDYSLWFELARARDQENDVEGAVAAFRESVGLAPFYADPHWQLGNTLFRAGRRDEAFVELRRAAISKPKLLPQAIGLAWASFGGDSQALEKVLQFQTPYEHLILASFLARHGRASESLAQFRVAGDPSNEQRRTLVVDLLASKDFAEAFEVWSSGRPANGEVRSRGVASIANGGFEEPITLDDPGFGWQLGRDLKALRASLDATQAHMGAYSLRVDWSGDSDPSKPMISQLVVVEPQTRYRVTFAARTQEMLTIGSPVVTVSDVGSDSERAIAQSKTFPQGTSSWQDYTIEFATTETTRAVLIAIRRQNCVMTPCAAIGHAWVDDFQLGRQ